MLAQLGRPSKNVPLLSEHAAHFWFWCLALKVIATLFEHQKKFRICKQGFCEHVSQI